MQLNEHASSHMINEPRCRKSVDFGRDEPYKLGLMTAGESPIQQWSTNELDVSEGEVTAASNEFQHAPKKLSEEPGPSLAGSSLAAQ